MQFRSAESVFGADRTGLGTIQLNRAEVVPFRPRHGQTGVAW